MKITGAATKTDHPHRQQQQQQLQRDPNPHLIHTQQGNLRESRSRPAAAPDLSALKPSRRHCTRKPTRRRRTKSPGSVRVPGTKRGSRPETPLLRWKFVEEEAERENSNVEDEKSPAPAAEVGRRCARRAKPVVSARKLAAGLWRMQLPEVNATPGDRVVGFQSGAGHLGVPFHVHHGSKPHISPANHLVQSPKSVSGPRNGFLCKLEASFQSTSAMEGATKWDPVRHKISDERKERFEQTELPQKQSAPIISALESELQKARTRIHELESERRSSKKKVEQFLKKLSEERAAWRIREHEKIRAIIDDMKADLSRERKNRQRLEVVNSKLVNELAEAKLSAKRFMQDYEKERRSRELIEEVCDELAKEIGEDKAEAEALKRESMRLREEVEEERKMLQMAEVWREERVQMKLVDAKVALEERYSQMKMLISALESFLSSKNVILAADEMRKAEHLRESAASVNIQDLREFTYEPSNPDDIFAVFEEVNFGESNERDIEPCGTHSPPSHASKIHTVSPEVNVYLSDNIQRHSNVYIDYSGDLEEDRSEWETVSHPGDQGSSFSPDGSDPSVKSHRHSNVSRCGTEWEGIAGKETPITEISEVCSVPTRQLKKVSSISRLWRSFPGNGENYKIISADGTKGRLSNGRLSNGAIYSPDHGSGLDGLSPPDLAGEWSSPDSVNQHITRGIKGCIEWPRSAQRNSLKSKLLEARMETQKIQLRQVLKQKI